MIPNSPANAAGDGIILREGAQDPLSGSGTDADHEDADHENVPSQGPLPAPRLLGWGGSLRCTLLCSCRLSPGSRLAWGLPLSAGVSAAFLLLARSPRRERQPGSWPSSRQRYGHL